MKKQFLLACAFVLVTSSSILAQSKSVSLHINHMLNGVQFSTIYAAKAPGNYFFRTSSLRYYVSKIKIVHDGGKVDEATGLYLLVNPENVSEYILGNFNITNVEAIQFGIGVDSSTNHLDPTTYPKDDPLAMQDPTMHWGWNAGYRFIAFNGSAGASNTSTSTSFELHALEDILYSSITVPTKGTIVKGNMIITLDAEYTNLLLNINANEGVISHSSTGASATMMKNMITSVFSTPKSSSVSELSEIPLHISPNPASGSLSISGLTLSNQTSLIITNMLGQIVLKQDIRESSFSIPLVLSIGTYIVSIDNGSIIQREKLIVTE